MTVIDSLEHLYKCDSSSKRGVHYSVNGSTSRRRVSEDQRLCDVDLAGGGDESESVEFDITFQSNENRKASKTLSTVPSGSGQLISSHSDDVDGDLGGVGAFSSVMSATASSSYNSISHPNSPEDESEETYTIDQAIEQLGYGRFQIRISCIAGLAWAADAIEMMVLSILSPALQCDWGLATWEQGLITSVVFIGMMFGSSLWGSIADRYGRKFVLIASSLFCLYFGIMSAMALDLIWLLIFRCMVGFGVSGGSNAVTLYSEFLPLKARAKSIVGIEVFFVLGSAFSIMLAFFVMPIMGWRWLLVFSAVPLLVFMIACKWLPESMRFNLSRGHVNAAKKTLEQCAKENNKPMPLGRLVPPSQQDSRGRIADLFVKELRLTTALLWFIWFANTFCYYGMVLLTTQLLQIQNNDVCATISSGHIEKVTCSLDCMALTSNNYLELLWTTAAEFPGLLITFFVIDVIGRKRTSAAQFFLFAISTSLVAVCKGRYFMIFWLFAARGFIAGAFQVAFVYTPEIYSTKCRALGLGTCSSLARLGAVITPFVAQVLLQTSIYATIGIYAGIAVLACIASLLLPIETKGKVLSEGDAEERIS